MTYACRCLLKGSESDNFDCLTRLGDLVSEGFFLSMIAGTPEESAKDFAATRVYLYLIPLIYIYICSYLVAG